MPAATCASRAAAKRPRQRLGHHHHARPAAVRPVVDGPVRIRREIARIPHAERPQSALQRATGDADTRDACVDHLREQRDDVDAHRPSSRRASRRRSALRRRQRGRRTGDPRNQSRVASCPATRTSGCAPLRTKSTTLPSTSPARFTTAQAHEVRLVMLVFRQRRQVRRAARRSTRRATRRLLPRRHAVELRHDRAGMKAARRHLVRLPRSLGIARAQPPLREVEQRRRVSDSGWTLNRRARRRGADHAAHHDDCRGSRGGQARCGLAGATGAAVAAGVLAACAARSTSLPPCRTISRRAAASSRRDRAQCAGLPRAPRRPGCRSRRAR